MSNRKKRIKKKRWGQRQRLEELHHQEEAAEEEKEAAAAALPHIQAQLMNHHQLSAKQDEARLVCPDLDPQSDQNQ